MNLLHSAPIDKVHEPTRFVVIFNKGTQLSRKLSTAQSHGHERRSVFELRFLHSGPFVQFSPEDICPGVETIRSNGD